ncbi:MAG TPA: ABC transporter substrate-binding protein [Polyangiaceae bacterium]|nr:ABC transporter substrate-binding protein [Polyangiaceae bacterium]
MKLRTLVLGSTMLLGALGCSSKSSDNKTPTVTGAAGDTGAGGDGAGTQSQVLQIFSWWTAPGEAEALTALEDTYQNKYPHARYSQFSNSSASTWQEVLGMQVDDSPWDVCQLSASDLDKFRVDHPGAVSELDDVYADAGLADAMIPEIRDVVTRNKHHYGVVTGVHRNNSFIYNQQIFDAQKLDPPTTIDEFMAVSAKLKEAGIMPVASDYDTWVLRIMFDEFLAGELGAQGFADFINGKTAATDPDVQAGITAAIDVFDTVITDYIDVTASQDKDYDWSSAARDLHDGNAAMLFHGDWAKGFLVHLGWTPGPDFGVLGPPGASDLFVYGADMFFLPATAPHQELGKNFLGVVASPEGQVAFNKYKGATPMRTDVRDQLDSAGQLSLDGLINAKVLMPGHANDGWDKGIETFAVDHDKAALLKVYTDTPP